MQSLISVLINKEWEQCISIGSMWYLNTARKTCKQLVCVLALNHSEEDRDVIMSWTQEELYHALMNTIKNNPLHVLYPN